MTRSKHILIAVAAATTGLISCGGESVEEPAVGSENATENASNNTTDVNSGDSYSDDTEAVKDTSEYVYDPTTDPPKLAQAEMKNRLSNDQTKAMFGNTSSAFKFVTTSSDYSIFGALMANTSMMKQLHADQITILAPSNDYWDLEEATALKYLVKEGKGAELDSYVKQYILDVPVAAVKLSLAAEHMNMDGSYLTMDADAQTIAGIKYDLEHIECANGSIVIPLKGTLPK